MDIGYRTDLFSMNHFLRPYPKIPKWSIFTCCIRVAKFYYVFFYNNFNLQNITTISQVNKDKYTILIL